MPYWYRLNKNHGSGAEHLFEGELQFMRGNFTDAIISLHRALHNANQNGQPAMAIAADFLRLRVETFQGKYDTVEPALGQMRELAGKSRLFMLQHTVDICEAWLFALSGQPDRAADWIAEGDLSSTRLVFPAFHFLHMVYCQLLLARGEYAALIAREEEERALYRVFPNLLSEIYLDVQLAAAYEQLSRRRTATNHLIRALGAAAPDNIFLPFVENCNTIIEPMREIPDGIWEDHIEKILALYLQNRMEKHGEITLPAAASANELLTERDLSIVRLLAAGKSNKEIAAELYLSESYVKTLLKRIFQKLGISDQKDKRSILAAML
jgi:LuxR family maltose regulon positive regulatory protein